MQRNWFERLLGRSKTKADRKDKSMEKIRYTGPGQMVVDEMGAGPRIVFVHGGGMGGAMAWQAQAPLADHWRLVMPARPGYGDSPWLGSEDFDRDAEFIADLLQPGDHVVAHSYGAAVAMNAAAKSPSKLASLTLIESGTSDIAKDHPDVTAFHYATLGLAANPPQDDADLLRTLFRIIEPSRQLPPQLPPPLMTFASHLRHFRYPSMAVVPVSVLAQATFPKLHISGGHSPAYEAITDRLAERLGGRREIIANGGHAPQQLGEPFNSILSEFLRS